MLGLNVKAPTYCIVDSFNYHMATYVDASPLNTTTCCHVKRQWSGRESRACPPTYGRQLGSTRSQLLSWDSMSQSTSLPSPASFSPPASSPQAWEEMHCSAGHSLCITFPLAPPWLDVVSSSLFFLPDWAKSLPGYSGVSRKLLMPFFSSISTGPLVWTHHFIVLWS